MNEQSTLYTSLIVLLSSVKQIRFISLYPKIPQIKIHLPKWRNKKQNKTKQNKNIGLVKNADPIACTRCQHMANTTTQPVLIHQPKSKLKQQQQT